MSSSALILPPTAPGSLGDEAMVVGSFRTLSQKGLKILSLVSHNPRLQYPVDASSTYDMRDYFIYTSPIKALIKVISFAVFASQYEYFYCLGADLMDGYYSDFATLKKVKLAEIASRLGLKSSILGFSFNDKPTKAAIAGLNTLPSQVRLCARDPLSYERLSKVLHEPATLVADLAFLVEPSVNSEKLVAAKEWIQQNRSLQKIIVGISPHAFLKPDNTSATKQDIQHYYMSLIESLSCQNSSLAFFILPHDYRVLENNLSDGILSQKIYSNLLDKLQSPIFLSPMPLRTNEVKELVAELDIVLTARMHLSIACLGQGTPVGCIAYQGKFAGLFQYHFAIQDNLISNQALFEIDSNKLVSWFLNLIEKRQMIQDKILSKLPDVQKLALKNFENIS